MTNHLVVKRPFLNFIRGDVIVDQTKVVEIMSGEYRKFITKILLPTTPKG